MKQIKIVFFGSFQHYSSIILEALIKSELVEIMAVVTTPPKPAGRKKELKKTHVHILAEKYNLKIFTPDNLKNQSPDKLFKNKPDLFLTAGYGKLLPKSWLDYPQFKSLNLHFSLLPKYRGANPAEYAILAREKETGITLIEMSEKFDEGALLAQAKINITDTDTRETIYEKLYELGAEKLPVWLSDYANWKSKDGINRVSSVNLPPTSQPKSSPTPYAKRLQRQDGFVPWQEITKAVIGNDVKTRLIASRVTLKVRALSGFPGVWTMVPTKNNQKRMKILSCAVKENRLILEKVQIEGQSIANWKQVKNAVI